MKKLSVIIPVYNAEEYLERCLNSIIKQTYQNIEIIVVNDGSTDNSEQIALELRSKYPNKVKYFKEEKKGVAQARNFGIKQVIGEYFLFVDSDDYIDIDLCENVAQNIQNQDIDIVKYKMKIIKDNKVTMQKGPVFGIKDGQDAFNELCFKDTLIDTPCLYLFNTKFYKKNDFKFLKDSYHEDFGLIPLIIIKSEQCISIDTYGYNYLQVNNSITRNIDYRKTVKKANDILLHYDNMIKFIQKNNFNKKTVKNIKKYYLNAIFDSVEKLKKEDKKTYYRKVKKKRLLNKIIIKKHKNLIKKAMTYLKN